MSSFTKDQVFIYYGKSKYTYTLQVNTSHVQKTKTIKVGYWDFIIFSSISHNINSFFFDRYRFVISAFASNSTTDQNKYYCYIILFFFFYFSSQYYQSNRHILDIP